MSIAATIALLRSFFVAGLLHVNAFGLYVTVISAGMFFSVLISFGTVEGTIKSFARQWLIIESRHATISQADTIGMHIAYRCASLLIITLCVYIFL